MRISDIIGMAEEYMKLGVTLTVLLAAVFGAGYFFFYKRVLKGRKRLRPGRAALWAVFLCYLIVVLGATLGRGGYYYQTRVWLVPFSSYREAWYSGLASSWRNLILNICMFVPFGFLLPGLSGRFRTPWKTYLAGAVFSLLIEIIQLVFHRGIFETDDILNNFLGAAIGYGFYRLFCFFAKRRGRRRDSAAVLAALQIPLCFTAAVYSAFFLVYHFQEFGNLGSAYYTKIPMKGVEIVLETQLSEERADAPIYQLHVADREETAAMAEEFLAGLGAGVDASRTDYYDNTAIYYSDNNMYSLWINYAGGRISVNDFQAGWDGKERVPGKEDADREEVETALWAMGFSVPEEAVFENLENGTYLFMVSRFLEDGVMYDGVLSCRYHINGRLSDVNNGIIAYQQYREGRIKTQQEAYEEILAGRFQYDTGGEKLTEIVLREVSLGYEADSKGYYQPVYLFDALCDQREIELVIPALQ